MVLERGTIKRFLNYQIFIILLVFLLASFVSADYAFLDPNGDVVRDWTPSAGTTHYTLIDDAIRQPDTPNEADYVSTSSSTTVTETFNMTSVAGIGSATVINVWYRCKGANDGFVAFTIGINTSGNWNDQNPASLGCGISPAWQNRTFTGTWTQSQIDELQIRFRYSDADLNQRFIYTAYVNLTYTTSGDTTPPLVTIVNPRNVTYTTQNLSLLFNVSLNENGSVIYSLNGGVRNVSMQGNESQFFGTGFNASNGSLATGSYIFSVYANDTSGNKNYTESITFRFEQTNLTSCQNLSLSHTAYTLAQSITTTGSCFNVTAHNVTLDGAGLKITGDDSGTDYGVFIAGFMNATIKNLNVTDFNTGMFLYTNTSVIANNSVFSSLDHGLDLNGFFNYIYNNTLIGNAFTNSNSAALNIRAVTNNTIELNSIYDNQAKGIRIAGFNNTIRNNRVRNSTLTGVFITGVAGNLLLNNNVSNHSGNSIASDTVPQTDGLLNQFIYNNSQGEIKWTNETFLDSLTITGDVVLGRTIQIGNGFVSLNTSAFSAGIINSSANVTLRGLTTNFRYPRIMRNNIDVCNSTSGPSCWNYTSLNAGTVVLNVTSWSNYSVMNNTDAPRVNITSPLAQTYTVNSYLINVTTNEASSCYYSLNSGTTNNTLSSLDENNMTFNETKSSVANGDYTLFAYCNNSLGNWNTSVSVSFSISVSSGGSGGSSGSGGGSLGNPPPQTNQSSCTAVYSCGEWGVCEVPGAQERTCVDFACEQPARVETRSCVVQCIPEWQCSSWSLCSSGQTSRTCLDSKSCGSDSGKPIELQMCNAANPDCTPSIICGDYGECSYTQEVENVLEGRIDLSGFKIRDCRDVNKCVDNYQDKLICTSNVIVELKETNICGKSTLTAYNAQTNAPITNINLESWKSERLDVSFVQKENQYCASCYNGIMDGDEQGIDCGGNCRTCLKELRFDYFKLLGWLLWLILLILLIITALLIRKEYNSMQKAKVIKALKRV